MTYKCWNCGTSVKDCRCHCAGRGQRGAACLWAMVVVVALGIVAISGVTFERVVAGESLPDCRCQECVPETEGIVAISGRTVERAP